MQVSVVTTSMRRMHWMISRSFATSAGSCPSRSQCAKSMQRAFVVALTRQRAPRRTSSRRTSRKSASARAEADFLAQELEAAVAHHLDVAHQVDIRDGDHALCPPEATDLDLV